MVLYRCTELVNKCTILQNQLYTHLSVQWHFTDRCKELILLSLSVYCTGVENRLLTVQLCRAGTGDLEAVKELENFIRGFVRDLGVEEVASAT